MTASDVHGKMRADAGNGMAAGNGWPVCRLADVADIVSGGTPSKARSDWWRGTLPWASPKDLKRPRLADTEDHITDEAATEGSRVVPPGSIFIVIRGMILARDVPVAVTETRMAFNQDMKAIIPRAEVDSTFVLYAIRARKDSLFQLIGTSAHGTRRISTSAIADFTIPVPSLDE